MDGESGANGNEREAWMALPSGKFEGEWLKIKDVRGPWDMEIRVTLDLVAGAGQTLS